MEKLEVYRNLKRKFCEHSKWHHFGSKSPPYYLRIKNPSLLFSFLFEHLNFHGSCIIKVMIYIVNMNCTFTSYLRKIFIRFIRLYITFVLIYRFTTFVFITREQNLSHFKKINILYHLWLFTKVIHWFASFLLPLKWSIIHYLRDRFPAQ